MNQGIQWGLEDRKVKETEPPEGVQPYQSLDF